MGLKIFSPLKDQPVEKRPQPSEKPGIEYQMKCANEGYANGGACIHVSLRQDLSKEGARHKDMTRIETTNKRLLVILTNISFDCFSCPFSTAAVSFQMCKLFKHVYSSRS